MKKIKNDDRSGLFIPAGVFLGLGVGFLTNQLVSWLFIGLGLGFVGMIFTMPKTKKK